MGNTLVQTAVSVHCLNAVERDILKAKASGQGYATGGTLLLDRDLLRQAVDGLSMRNGILGLVPLTFGCVLQQTAGVRGDKRCPMMVAFSIDYGTLNNRLWHQNRKLSVKVYHPMVVQVLKSLDSRLQPFYPRNINGVKGQNNSALAMIHIVSGTSDMSLGEVRLEVTVKAVSLREVLKRVEEEGLLDPSTG
jgi:hypothetical protein